MTTLANFVATQTGLAYAAVVTVAIVIVAVGWFVLAAQRRPLSGRRPLIIAACVLATAGLLFVSMIGARRGIGAFDSAVSVALADFPQPAWAGFFATVTHLADRTTLVAVTLVVAGMLVFARRRLLLFGWLVACCGNGLLNPALKNAFARARPIHDPAYGTVGEYSFPSGHTSGAVVVYGMLAYVVMRMTTRRWHPWIAVTAATIVATIPCSRVFLRVHWASDVVAGLGSGTAWLTVCIVAIELLRRRRPGLGGPLID